MTVGKHDSAYAIPFPPMACYYAGASPETITSTVRLEFKASSILLPIPTALAPHLRHVTLSGLRFNIGVFICIVLYLLSFLARNNCKN